MKIKNKSTVEKQNKTEINKTKLKKKCSYSYNSAV